MIAEIKALQIRVAELEAQLEACSQRSAMWRERCADAQLAVAQMDQLHQDALREIAALLRDKSADAEPAPLMPAGDGAR